MGFKEALASGAKKLFGRKEKGEELPDDVTRDKALRSLRRQRRVQLEEMEKEQLKKDIAEHNKMRMREAFYSSHVIERMPREHRPLLKEGKRLKVTGNMLRPMKQKKLRRRKSMFM